MVSAARTPLAALAVTILLYACAPGAMPSASPIDDRSVLVNHAHAASSGLEEALRLYRAGDRQAAVDLAAEAYEQHFEVIEHPLGDIDEEFMESLELLIAHTIRDAMQNSAPADEVAALIDRARASLAQAAEMLE